MAGNQFSLRSDIYYAGTDILLDSITTSSVYRALQGAKKGREADRASLPHATARRAATSDYIPSGAAAATIERLTRRRTTLRLTRATLRLTRRTLRLARRTSRITLRPARATLRFSLRTFLLTFLLTFLATAIVAPFLGGRGVAPKT